MLFMLALIIYLPFGWPSNRLGYLFSRLSFPVFSRPGSIWPDMTYLFIGYNYLR